MNDDDLQFLNTPEFCFVKRFKDIHNFMHKTFRQQLKAEGVTPSQLSVILELRKMQMCEQIEEVNQIMLAEALFIEAISLARTLDKMEKLNLITRSPNTTDKRVKIVKLNYECNIVKNVLQNVREVGFNVSSSILKCLDEAEKAQFLQILEKLNNNLCGKI